MNANNLHFNRPVSEITSVSALEGDLTPIKRAGFIEKGAVAVRKVVGEHPKLTGGLTATALAAITALGISSANGSPSRPANQEALKIEKDLSRQIADDKREKLEVPYGATAYSLVTDVYKEGVTSIDGKPTAPTLSGVALEDAASVVASQGQGQPEVNAHGAQQHDLLSGQVVEVPVVTPEQAALSNQAQH